MDYIIFFIFVFYFVVESFSKLVVKKKIVRKKMGKI